MANFTNAQFKHRIENLKKNLLNLKTDFEKLEDDLEQESFQIEPLEGHDSLIAAQEERSEWLEDFASKIDDVVDQLTEVEAILDDIQ